MNFNLYDIVIIETPFTLKHEGKDYNFNAGVKGVIVETYNQEFLVEFLTENEVTLYVLVSETELKKIWDNLNAQFC